MDSLTVVEGSNTEIVKNDSLQHLPLHTFQGFIIDSIIEEDSISKKITLLGHFQNFEGKAIAILEKESFKLEKLFETMSNQTQLSLNLQNAQYGQYNAILPFHENYAQVKFIYPCTLQDLEKYSHCDYLVIQESYESYLNITRWVGGKYIESIPPSRVQWVYNILNGLAEVDRVVYRDEDKEKGFVLVSDWKWSGQNPKELYLIAICQRKDIQSLRDLHVTHLPLLRNIKNSESIIHTKYNLPPSKLRTYVHYQPSYYHFHVHFTHLDHDVSGTGLGKAYLLSDIINNIELFGDYYQKVSLSCLLPENHGLVHAFNIKQEKE